MLIISPAFCVSISPPASREYEAAILLPTVSDFLDDIFDVVDKNWDIFELHSATETFTKSQLSYRTGVHFKSRWQTKTRRHNKGRKETKNLFSFLSCITVWENHLSCSSRQVTEQNVASVFLIAAVHGKIWLRVSQTNRARLRDHKTRTLPDGHTSVLQPGQTRMAWNPACFRAKKPSRKTDSACQVIRMWNMLWVPFSACSWKVSGSQQECYA